MRKFINIAIVALAVGFFSCSDDDSTDTTGYVSKNVTINGAGAEDNPAGWGNEVVVTGEGFSNKTLLYIRPAQSNIDPDRGTAIDLLEQSATSLKFNAPLTDGGGQFELLQVENDAIYSLGMIYLKEEKYPLQLVGNVNSSEWGTNVSFYEFEYDKGKITKISRCSSSDQFGKTIEDWWTFQYDSQQRLVKSVREGAWGVMKECTFDYKTATNIVLIEDEGYGYPKTSTLTLNAAGQMTNRSMTWEEAVDIYEEEFPWDYIETVIHKYETTFTYEYDANGNLLEYNSVTSKNNVQTETSFMKLRYDSQKAFFPHILPSWYWNITTTEHFNLMLGYANNIASYTVPGGGGPFGGSGDVVINYEIEYAKNAFPLYIYNLNEMFDGSIQRFKAFDIVYN